MTKTIPFMTVEFKVDRDDVEYSAECIVDTLYDDYNEEAFNALGVTYKGLKNEIMDLDVFHQMVRKGVEKYGPDALSDPHDYMNFDLVEYSSEYKRLIAVLDLLSEVIDDAERHDRAQANDPCAEAIKTLQRAGFKIVKA